MSSALTHHLQEQAAKTFTFGGSASAAISGVMAFLAENSQAFGVLGMFGSLLIAWLGYRWIRAIKRADLRNKNLESELLELKIQQMQDKVGTGK